MEQIIAFAAVIAVITTGLTQVVKKASVIPKNIIPAVSMVLGAAIGGASVFIPEIGTEISIGGRILAGLISGLMATGLWETFKKRTGNTAKNDNKIGGGGVK